MGLLDIFKQKGEPIDASSITQEDLVSRRYENKTVIIKGHVTIQRVIMENYPGFDFQD
ncbi:MAG: hypothetical protein U9R60_07715 [Bacteroidota bacterium]|nr:hypothetical protein [Bacteroidota bacterium]